MVPVAICERQLRMTAVNIKTHCSEALFRVIYYISGNAAKEYSCFVFRIEERAY